MSASPVSERILRFDRTERIVHWCNATLFLVLLFTGASLYVAPLSALVAHRTFVKTVHVYSGLLLPVPIVLGLVLRSGKRLRADLSRLNRWNQDDRFWMRHTWSQRSLRNRARLGKFNPGQKLNAAFVGASIVVMLGTGSIMRWFEPFPDDWRTGATFVHDWFFIALCIVITGHILYALADPESLRAMVTGWVTERWARTHSPTWYAEVTSSGEARPAADSLGDGAARVDDRAAEVGTSAGEVAVGDAVDGGAGDRVGGREL
jgi:formate dehydrogenase subunit gamma